MYIFPSTGFLCQGSSALKKSLQIVHSEVRPAQNAALDWSSIHWKTKKHLKTLSPASYWNTFEFIGK